MITTSLLTAGVAIIVSAITGLGLTGCGAGLIISSNLTVGLNFSIGSNLGLGGPSICGGWSNSVGGVAVRPDCCDWRPLGVSTGRTGL